MDNWDFDRESQEEEFDAERFYQEALRDVRDSGISIGRKRYVAREYFPEGYQRKAGAVLTGSNINKKGTEFESDNWIKERLEMDPGEFRRKSNKFARDNRFEMLAPSARGPASYTKPFSTAVTVAEYLNRNGNQKEILGENHIVGLVPVERHWKDLGFEENDPNQASDPTKQLRSLYGRGVVGRGGKEKYGEEGTTKHVLTMNLSTFEEILQNIEKTGLL